ncbi:AraC family transcriptional regulator [Paenibacillus hamazuiensis]|uniref:AraC family transcriptional regulator n=1 Tax=Paenibacillus hamazuiensis TaxID=2936508 RepID=UPI00201054A6|nr:helix-turn-helix domain-containing protein [Paenibacillus hamazuiensis]
MEDALHALFRPIQANGRVVSQKYIEFKPSPALMSFVSCYWASEPSFHPDSANNDGIDRVLPDGCTDILFEHDIKGNRYHIRYYGVFDRPFPIAYDDKRPVRKFGVRFFPGGAYPFMRTPVAEFTGRYCALDAIWPNIAEEIGEKLFAQESMEEKVRIIEHYLLTIAQRNRPVDDPLMANLLYRIFVSEGKTGVCELAESEAVSARQINRKFEQWIGFSPKKFSEIVRFQAVVGDIRRRKKTDWRMLALDHGYFDQAHMIRDFKRFYGDSPLAAAKEFRDTSGFYNPI